MLVVFYSPECHVCKDFIPLLDKVVRHTGIHVKKINLEKKKYRHLAKKYKINAVPQLVVISGERIVDTFEKERTPQKIAKFLYKHQE